MANGDIALSVPKTLGNLVLVEFIITLQPSQRMFLIFAEGVGGPQHVVQLTDTSAVGFSYAAGVYSDSIAKETSPGVPLTGEFTKLIGVLFGAGASTVAQRKTNAVQTLITDGVMSIAGTVG